MKMVRTNDKEINLIIIDNIKASDKLSRNLKNQKVYEIINNFKQKNTNR